MTTTTDKALPTKPLAWISADLSRAITARQVENIPELGGDPSALYPIPLYAGVPDNTLSAIRPSPEELRTLARYDPATGLIYWLPRLSARWNSRHAGKLAFHQMDKGYFGGRLGGRNYKAHRIAWALHYGEWPSRDLDHINGVRSDNRIENLRIVTPAENAKNLRPNSKNKSGMNGVSWSTRIAKWQASISVDRKKIHLGFFEEKEAAISARAEANVRYGFHENHGH